MTETTPTPTPTPANGGASLLEVHDVCKYFGNVIAIKDVSAAVYAPQVTCVLRENGAGKSGGAELDAPTHELERVLDRSVEA
jgi:ABC-type phosphonate transport system ATPase subunit